MVTWEVAGVDWDGGDAFSCAWVQVEPCSVEGCAYCSDAQWVLADGSWKVDHGDHRVLGGYCEVDHPDVQESSVSLSAAGSCYRNQV